MAPLQYLVIGANRGLGFEFVRQILQKPDTRVVATYRDARKIDDLKKLSEQTGSGRLELVQLDMTDDSSCKAAAQEVRSRVGSLDILIVNAGVITPEKPLLDESLDDMLAMFSRNILGPLRIIQHFAPVLSSIQSKLVLITSEKGSLAAGKKASFPAYSISKAALNMLGRKISYELEGSRVAVALVDPGWVQTDMGGSDAPLTPSKSVGGILNVVEQVGMHNSGEYWRWDGQPLAW